MSTQVVTHSTFKPGDVVIESMPLIYCLHPWFVRSYCAGCFIPVTNSNVASYGYVEKLNECEECGQFRYCSPECQASDWNNFHQHECQTYVKYGRRRELQSIFGRVSLRCWILLTKRTEDLLRPHDVLGGGCFMDLEDHQKKWEQDSNRVLRDQHILDFLRAAGLEFEDEQLKSVIFRYHCNASDIATVSFTEAGESIGSGLYMESTIFGHSCSPNASMVFNGLKMQVRAIQEIEPSEPIYVAKCDVSFDRESRQEILRLKYFISCTCIRCSKDDSTDEEVCRKINSLRLSLAEKLEPAEVGEFPLNEFMSELEELLIALEHVYSPYDPVLTCRRMKYFVPACKCDKPPILSGDQLVDEVRITHGPDHPRTLNFTFLKGCFDQLDTEGVAKLADRLVFGRQISNPLT